MGNTDLQMSKKMQIFVAKCELNILFFPNFLKFISAPAKAALYPKVSIAFPCITKAGMFIRLLLFIVLNFSYSCFIEPYIHRL
jgi:hypothetical protein